MGGSVGKNKNQSSSSASQNVWEPQGNALQQLWNAAFGNLSGNQFMDQIGGAAQGIQDKINGLFGQQSDLNDKLAGGGAYGDTSAIKDKLLGMMGGRTNTGTMYESIVGGNGNTYIDPMIERLRQDSAKNVDTFRGNNAVDAAMYGQSGSSRQAMEDAMFGAEANKNLLDKEAELRAGAYDKDLSLKLGIAGLADSNKQAEQDRLLSMIQGSQNSMNSAKDGGGLLAAIAGMGMTPWLQAQQAKWNPFNNLANIIGGPTILGSSSSSGKSKGFGGSASLWG